MKLIDLQNMVRHGETEAIEFKKTTGQRTDAVKTICAMLNGGGGFVLFGITPEGTIQGQQVTSRTLEDVANAISHIEPPAFPDIERIPVTEHLTVILIRVSGGGLYTYEGRAYIRYGATTRVMPREEYERRLLEHMHGKRRWENQPAYGITLNDLDHDEIIRTVEEAIRRGRMNDPQTRDPLDLLHGFKLIKEGEILNAAVVLFAKRNSLMPYYPQCLLKMARFRGRTRLAEIDDNRQVMANAFEIYTLAQRFILDHLPIASRFEPDNFYRIDEPLYPTAALREAIANAICHRDYGKGTGAISIAIYDDRLEIQSTGTLPFGLTPAALTRPHISLPWNPLIAQVFYRKGLIETWGRGTLKIISLVEQAGLVPPEFEMAYGEVTVRFLPQRYTAPQEVGHKLSNLQRELLQILSTTGEATLSTIKAKMTQETASRTIQENLAFLRQLGLVWIEGRGRSARWTLLRSKTE